MNRIDADHGVKRFDNESMRDFIDLVFKEGCGIYQGKNEFDKHCTTGMRRFYNQNLFETTHQ